MIYRFLKSCLMASTLVLAFTSFTAVAQPQGGAQAPAQLDATQLAQLDAATTPAQLVAAVRALAASGAAPAALAGALSQRGQTLNQITTTLVQADVPTTQVAVAVRTAVPGTTVMQVSSALMAANVPPNARQAAVRAVAALPTTPQVQQPAAPPAAVASITGAGLLVGADGQAVTVRDQGEQLLAVAAFVSRSLQNNPNSLSDPNLRNAIGGIVASSLRSVGAAANPQLVMQAIILIQSAFEEAPDSAPPVQSVFPGLILPTPTPTPTPPPVPEPTPAPTPTPPAPYGV